MKPTPKQVIELLDIFNDIGLTKVQAIEQIWQKAQDDLIDKLFNKLETGEMELRIYMKELKNRKDKSQ
jgi:hypothetical protein